MSWMAEKDPWQYCKSIIEGDTSWVVLGAEIIPLPAHKCPDQIPDWSVNGLPKEPTPYQMPTFVIDQIITMQNGRKRATIYMAQAPSRRATRDILEIACRWRPAPPSAQPVEPEEVVVLSRYKRAPII